MGDASTPMGRLFMYGMSTMQPTSPNYGVSTYSPAWASWINQGGTAPGGFGSGGGTVQTGRAGAPVGVAPAATTATATGSTAGGVARSAAAGGSAAVTPTVTGTGSTLGGGVQQRSLLG